MLKGNSGVDYGRYRNVKIGAKCFGCVLQSIATTGYSCHHKDPICFLEFPRYKA